MEKRNAHRILVGKTEEKRPLERSRCRLIDNIKMDFKRDRMEWCGPHQFGSGWGPVDGPCEHSNKPSCSMKCWEVLE
jgi:hypothetical protein